jgi:hypothetical protein
MKQSINTLVQVLSLVLSYTVATFAYGAVTPPTTELKKRLPYYMFFNPAQNGVTLDKQRIDFDLSGGRILKVGPYTFSPDSVKLNISREPQDFFEYEFGFEKRLKRGATYVISFDWPQDYMRTGIMELIDDKGRPIWRRGLLEPEIQAWQKTKSENKLSIAHKNSVFGFANEGIREFPLAQVKEPFRFCLSQEEGEGRLAICSRRYIIDRRFGNFNFIPVSKDISPFVRINDKQVTLIGTAMFLDFQTFMKFSALLKDGTYVEFVTRPRDVGIVDVIANPEKNIIELIGFGDKPVNMQLVDTFYADPLNEGLLNFTPTIGDTREYWYAHISAKDARLYLRGEGGFPLRQGLFFDRLPTKDSRLQIEPTSPRQTYGPTAKVIGSTDKTLNLSSKDTTVTYLNEKKFEWTFLAPNKGEVNTGSILIKDDDKTWQGSYQLYRGYALELSARVTSIVSDELDFVVLGEVAGQYWFEKFLGSNDFKTSLLRWGVAVKYFDTVFVGNEDPVDQSIVGLKVLNFDIKYRARPGVWQRDPTVGAIISAQKINFTYRADGVAKESENSMFGGGVFWARSMPKPIDDFFNVLPIFRYPKWVDVEFIFYPFPFVPQKTLTLNTALNFHGKVQWTGRFFGEAGFGLKTIGYKDRTLSEDGVGIGLGLAYATFGLGYNF